MLQRRGQKGLCPQRSEEAVRARAVPTQSTRVRDLTQKSSLDVAVVSGNGRNPA